MEKEAFRKQNISLFQVVCQDVLLIIKVSRHPVRNLSHLPPPQLNLVTKLIFPAPVMTSIIFSQNYVFKTFKNCFIK